MAKSIFTLLCLLFFSLALVKPVQASHILGGEIMYHSDTTANANPLQYFFKLVTYQDGYSATDDAEATLYLGDGVSVSSYRTSKIAVSTSCGLIFRNTYFFQHTYPGPGTYTALFRSVNRTRNIVNMVQSDQQSVTIKSEFVIDLFDSRIAPLRFVSEYMPCAVANQPFQHSLAVYNRDGDSLVHELITPLKSMGDTDGLGVIENVTGYTLPQQVSINAKTGELIWNKPQRLGLHSFAVQVSHYRNKRLVGSIMRDFIVNVLPTPDDITQAFSIENRSELSITDDNQISLTPGQPLKLKVKYQTSGQAKNLNAYSELYQLEPFTIDTTATTSTITAELTLNPKEAWRRKQPYILVFRGTSELNQIQAQQDFTITLVATPEVVSGVSPGPGDADPGHEALFAVYPNPAQNYVWVKNQKLLPRTHYLLYNALQQQILKTELNKLNTRITLPAVANGIYFYQIISDSGQVRQTGKLHIE